MGLKDGDDLPLLLLFPMTREISWMKSLDGVFPGDWEPNVERLGEGLFCEIERSVMMWLVKDEVEFVIAVGEVVVVEVVVEVIEVVTEVDSCCCCNDSWLLSRLKLRVLGLAFPVVKLERVCGPSEEVVTADIKKEKEQNELNCQIVLTVN